MDLKAEAGPPSTTPSARKRSSERWSIATPGPIYDSSMRDIFELILHRIRDLEINAGVSQVT